MIEFGKTLRAAREAKGLAPNDIAQRTHMMIQTVEGLENEDFSKIVAPIYGRGFVKLYCDVVGLEPKPMVDAFMELYNGTPRSRTPRHDEPPAPPPPQPQAAQAAYEPPSAPAPSPRTETTPPKPEQPLSRYAGNLPPELEPRFKMPSINVNWRLVALAAGAFAVLLVATLAIRAVYKATMTAPEYETEETESIVTDSVRTVSGASGQADGVAGGMDAADAAPKTPRKPLPPRPFYIDSDHSTKTERK